MLRFLKYLPWNLPGTPRHVWVPLPAEVAEMLGIAKEATSPAAAQAEWKETFPGEMPPELPATQDFAADYLPSSAGYPVRLLDGNMSRLRFRRDPRVPSGFTAEWRVANRAFPVPPEFQLEAAVLRVTEYFSVPHMKLDLTPEAQQMHMSYQGGLNVQSHMARERADPVGGARLGAAPWHIGVLAGLLLVYEIFSGVYSADRLQQKDLQVTPDHLRRAFALVKIAGS